MVSCVVIVCMVCLENAFAQVPGIPGIGVRAGGRNRQPPQQQQAQQQFRNLPVLETTGIVDAVVPGYIRILSGQNQLLVLQVLGTAKCQLTGKAKPEALGPGYYVRFLAAVNKRGMVEDKITKLTVFTPTTFRQPGAEPDSGMGTTFGPRPGADKKKGEEKAKPAFGAGAAAAAEAGKAAAGAHKAAGAVGAGAKGAGAEVYDVRGVITGVPNGKVKLHVPNTYFRSSLTVEIAEDADIDVELDDPMAYTLARKGDKIEVKGRLALGGDRGFAEELDIILGEPLGSSQDAKKAHAKGAKSKRGDAEEPPAAKAGEGKAEKKDADPFQKGKKTEAKKSAKSDDAEEAADAPEAKPKKKAAKRKKATPDDEAEK